jgi:hypothetical protein
MNTAQQRFRKKEKEAHQKVQSSSTSSKEAERRDQDRGSSLPLTPKFLLSVGDEERRILTDRACLQKIKNGICKWRIAGAHLRETPEALPLLNCVSPAKKEEKGAR